MPSGYRPAAAGTVTTVLLLIAAPLTAAAPVVVEYHMSIDGVRAPSHTLAPGAHEVMVEAIVRNDEVTPGVFGGFIQSAYHLNDDADAIAYTPKTGFLGGPGRFWDSQTNPAFTSHDSAWLFENLTLALDETGTLVHDDWNTRFADVGAGVLSFITRGPFTFSGATTTLRLIPINGGVQVAQLVEGGIIGRAPDQSIGDTTVLQVPEPAAWLLAAGLLAPVAAYRRRRRGAAISRGTP